MTRKHHLTVNFYYGIDDVARTQVIPRVDDQPQVAVKFYPVLDPGLTLYLDLDAVDRLIGVLTDAKTEAMHAGSQPQ
jgi:hypothetical protein